MLAEEIGNIYILYFILGGVLTGGGSSSYTITQITSDVTTIVTAAITWVQSFANAITANPLILMFVIIAFVGLGVGLIRRLIRL